VALLGHLPPKDLAAHQRRDKVQAEYPLDWLSWQVEEGLVFACVADETGVVWTGSPTREGMCSINRAGGAVWRRKISGMRPPER